MIAHTSVAGKDYSKSKELYEKMLAPLGYAVDMDVPEYKAAGFKEGNNRDFWIGETDSASGVHVAFLAKDKDAVDAFYAAGLSAGGKDNGAPGYRKQYAAGYYGAFVYDYDGNNIEAVWFDPNPPA